MHAIGLDSLPLEPSRHPGHLGAVILCFIGHHNRDAAGPFAQVMAEHPGEALDHPVRATNDVEIAIRSCQRPGHPDAPGTESNSVITMPFPEGASSVGMISGRMTPGSKSRNRFIRLYETSESGFPWSR